MWTLPIVAGVPIHNPVKYNLQINLPTIKSSSNYACIAPKEATKSFFITFNFKNKITTPSALTSLKNNKLVVKLSNAEEYEISGKAYPSSSICDLTVSPSGTELVFFNLKEHSCILKIKKK